MKRVFLQGATLLLFFTGISCFVLYRSGAFKHAAYGIQTSHNGGSLTNTTASETDSLPDIDQEHLTIMSSSKSIVITERKRSFYPDTSLHLEMQTIQEFMRDSVQSQDAIQNTEKKDSTEKHYLHFYSPKSGPVFDRPVLGKGKKDGRSED
ncbi:MAG: hypothetical protein R2794_00435 [Chitinophagales bacterium]